MEANEFSYKENGISFYIRFVGLNEDPAQFEIVTSESDPLKGDLITIKSETIVPYNTNLFYEPIPFEFLKTYETKPQLIVEVDGLPAVCHNLTCDFTYTESVGEVTAFTFDTTSKLLTVTGTNLPTSIDKIRQINYAMSPCTIQTSTL